MQICPTFSNSKKVSEIANDPKYTAAIENRIDLAEKDIEKEEQVRDSLQKERKISDLVEKLEKECQIQDLQEKLQSAQNQLDESKRKSDIAISKIKSKLKEKDEEILNCTVNIEHMRTSIEHLHIEREMGENFRK